MSEAKKLYPLVASQRMHYFTVQYCPLKQVLNIGTSLTIEADIDFDVLKESIYEAYDRCECMRIRFTKDENGEVKQYIADKEERDIPFFEFGHWKYEDAENEMKKWTAIPFERFDSPMNKVVMISMPDGFKGVYLLVDHMTLDAQAIVLFLKDVIQIYCSKKYDYEYPKPLQSFVKALEKDLKYENNSKAQQKDRQFWTDFLEESEPIYNDATGDNKLERERIEKNNPNLRAAVNGIANCEAEIAQFHLEPQPSDVLVKFCEENQVSMASLLLMAVRTYLQKVNNNEPDVSIQNTVSRRATLLEKGSGGSRVHFFPCRTIINTDETFIEGCRKIRDSQNNVFRHANFDPIEFMSMRSKCYNNARGETYEPMTLTYQPLSMRSDDMPDIRYKTNWYTNGVAAQNLYLTVMHRSLDNGLDFCFEYKKEKYNYEELEKIYYFITRIIFEGVQNPDKTIAEIIANA
ncbi:MAG: condensation domain-containing protein [Ruminococcus sp.]|nr:condensation domain-containing protein [Ruminococcus sp.]